MSAGGSGHGASVAAGSSRGWCGTVVVCAETAMRTQLLRLALCVVPFALVACDATPDEEPKPKKRKRLSEMKQAGTDQTPEELAAARKAAGFKTQEEIAAENAAMFEKGDREYVKTRLPEYREFTKTFRGILDDLEAQGPKWTDDKAFGKFEGKYKEKVKEFTKTYDALSGKGTKGGNLQVELGKAFRTWEDLNTALGPKIGDNPKFKEKVAEIRKMLDKVKEGLDGIEKDDSLKIDETYKPSKKEK